MSRSITSLNIAVKKRDSKYVRGDKLVGHKALGREKKKKGFECVICLFVYLPYYRRALVMVAIGDLEA